MSSIGKTTGTVCRLTHNDGIKRQSLHYDNARPADKTGLEDSGKVIPNLHPARKTDPDNPDHLRIICRAHAKQNQRASQGILGMGGADVTDLSGSIRDNQVRVNSKATSQ